MSIADEGYSAASEVSQLKSRRTTIRKHLAWT